MRLYSHGKLKVIFGNECKKENKIKPLLKVSSSVTNLNEIISNLANLYVFLCGVKTFCTRICFQRVQKNHCYIYIQLHPDEYDANFKI